MNEKIKERLLGTDVRGLPYWQLNDVVEDLKTLILEEPKGRSFWVVKWFASDGSGPFFDVETREEEARKAAHLYDGTIIHVKECLK